MIDPRFHPYIARFNSAVERAIHVTGIHHLGLIAYCFMGWAVYYAKAAGRDKRHMQRLIDYLWEQTSQPNAERDAHFVDTIGEWREDNPIEGIGSVRTTVEVVNPGNKE